MPCRFSIIVPTCGRRSLDRTLESIGNQPLVVGDEVLLVTDGPQPLAAELFARSGLPGRCIETCPSRDYGGAQRNRGMDEAAGDYLLFMDDDDVFSLDAFAMVRAALREAPDRPHLFRMRYAVDGRLLWDGRDLVLGNVSTQMLVCPNRPDLRRWDSAHGHDYRFVVNNLPLWSPGSLVWREEVIAVLRPHDAPRVDSPAPGEPREGPIRVSECCFRTRVHEEAGVEVACCRLLEQISGVEDAGWCDVRRDACESCCRSFPPSPVTLNPVVASLLYGLVLRILGRGGVTGCDHARAARLYSWAECGLAGE
jgi:hypothetical protein